MEELFDGLESVLVAHNDLRKSNHLSLGFSPWSESDFGPLAFGLDENKDLVIDTEKIICSDYLDPMAALHVYEEAEVNQNGNLPMEQLSAEHDIKRKRKREILSDYGAERSKKLRIIDNAALFESGETVLSNTDDTQERSERDYSAAVSDSEDVEMSESDGQVEREAIGEEEKEHVDGHRVTRTANGGKVYECSYCDYATYRKVSVELHIVQHHEPERRKHKCAKCGRTFARRDGLNRHQAVHDPSKRRVAREHKCKQCDKDFTSKSKLDHHVLIMHKGQAHTCELCNSKLSSGYSLRRHMQTCHGISPDF